MIKKRVLTALCGILILSVVIWFDKPLPWFTLVAAIWGLWLAEAALVSLLWIVMLCVGASVLRGAFEASDRADDRRRRRWGG